MALAYPTHAQKAIFVDLLAEGASATAPATQAQLDAWIEDRELPFTTAIDPPGTGQGIAKDFSAIENAYLIDLRTMQILEHAKAPSTLFPSLDAL